LAIIDVERDYYKLFEDTRKELKAFKFHLEKQLLEEKNSRQELEETLHRSKKDWEELMNSRRDLEKQTKELENQKKSSSCNHK